MEEVSKRDLNPVKGTRDFSPEIQILRKKVFEKIEKIFQRYGFDPMETPIIEKWEILKGKYGEEAENRLIWRFKLPYSEKEYALRYDLTVPLARFVARFKPKLPFKRYHIGRVFRYEEPQKGRYREFWQADFDIVGAKEISADAEVLNIVIEIFEEFKFKEYKIKINDRRILRGIFEKSLQIKNFEKILSIYRIIDKLDKIGKEKVIKELEKLEIPKNSLNKINELLEISKEKNETIISYLENYQVEEISKAINDIKQILDLVYKKDVIKIDLSLVRGLDYYTAMIFEAVVSKPKIGSLAGGGRYDELIKIFTNTEIPAVGGSIGVERLIDAGLEIGIFKADKKTYSQIAIIYTLEVPIKKIFEIAKELRDYNLNVYMPLKGFNSILDGIKEISKRGIKHALIVGKKEIEENIYTLQNLETREKFKVKLEEVVKLLSV